MSSFVDTSDPCPEAKDVVSKLTTTWESAPSGRDESDGLVHAFQKVSSVIQMKNVKFPSPA